jgi:hypothetical protein
MPPLKRRVVAQTPELSYPRKSLRNAGDPEINQHALSMLESELQSSKERLQAIRAELDRSLDERQKQGSGRRWVAMQAELERQENSVRELERERMAVLERLKTRVSRMAERPKSPCDPPLLALPDMIECAKWRDLKQGSFAFEPRRVMDQGREERVFVRAARETMEMAAPALRKGFKSGGALIKPIQAGPLMRAVLDYSQEDFSVRRVGEEKKVVEAPYTEWSWEVTPLVGGEKELRVLVYAELMLPNGSREPFEASTGSAVIHVQTRPSYLVGKFISGNWQWLLGSPIVLGLGWLGVRLKTSKKRQAGF